MAVFNAGDEIQLTCAYSFVLDNFIGAEGARALAEPLKQNTTLTHLNLMSKCVAVFNVGDEIQLTCDSFVLANEIGAEGARALAESLKQNTTLTQLNLSCMSEISVWLFLMRVMRFS